MCTARLLTRKSGVLHNTHPSWHPLSWSAPLHETPSFHVTPLLLTPLMAPLHSIPFTELPSSWNPPFMQHPPSQNSPFMEPLFTASPFMDPPTFTAPPLHPFMAPPLWTEKHLWKHYLPTISFASGNNESASEKLSQRHIFILIDWVHSKSPSKFNIASMVTVPLVAKIPNRPSFVFKRIWLVNGVVCLRFHIIIAVHKIDNWLKRIDWTCTYDFDRFRRVGCD